jgi:hypothetical protein
MALFVAPTVMYGTTVVRYASVSLRCWNVNCPDRTIVATFDEVQRVFSCPSCGVPVFIPEQYRGSP